MYMKYMYARNSQWSGWDGGLKNKYIWSSALEWRVGKPRRRPLAYARGTTGAVPLGIERATGAAAAKQKSLARSGPWREIYASVGRPRAIWSNDAASSPMTMILRMDVVY